MAKKPKPRVRVRIAVCELYCSQPMNCPLCGVLVPAHTDHTCSKEQS